MQKLLLSLSILSQNFESVKSSEGFIYLVIQFYFPVHRSKTFSHRSGEARADNEDFPPTRRTFPREIWLMSLTLIDIARYKSLIEQSYSCTVRYFDRPYSFCELVTWPTKISDDTITFLFNKCNIFYHCLIIVVLYGEKPQIWILKNYVNYKSVLQELFLITAGNRHKQEQLVLQRNSWG